VQERAEQLSIRKRLAAKRERLPARHAPRADVERINDEPVALAANAEDVAIVRAPADDLLRLQRTLDRCELIAIPRRLLEAFGLGRFFHARAKHVEELRALPLEEEHRVLDVPTVLLGRDVVHRRCREAGDLAQQAWALTVRGGVVVRA